MPPKTILITGATGTQGSHVTYSLLAAGHTVHAFTRNISSTSALALQQAGARLFQGDFDSVPSITAAAEGCSYAFINVSPVFTDPDGEARHGKNVVDACLKAGVKHVLLSSVPHLERVEALVRAGTEDGDGDGNLNLDSNANPNPNSKPKPNPNPTLKYRASKISVERSVLNAAGFESWTVLQLPRLLSSFVAPLSRYIFPSLASDGMIRTSLGQSMKQSVLDPVDIGRVVAVIIGDGANKYHNRKVALEGERLTMAEIVAAMNAVLGEEGRRVRIEQIEEDAANEMVQQGNLIVAGEMLFTENPEMLVVGDVQDFGFRMHKARDYFAREKKALERAVGLEQNT